MDITDSLAPASDQLDAIELIGGPRTFTIEKVTAGSAEQPVQIHLAGFPRPWRPAKSMRRVIAAAWGTDSTAYVGRSITLFYDPEVTFGKDKPGGTRIAAMSDLPGGKRLSTPLLVSRGKSAMYHVEPLTAPVRPAEPTAEQIAATTDLDALRAMHRAASVDVKALILARVAELNADQPMIPSAS